jgi:hypothetical protein
VAILTKIASPAGLAAAPALIAVEGLVTDDDLDGPVAQAASE